MDDGDSRRIRIASRTARAVLPGTCVSVSTPTWSTITRLPRTVGTFSVSGDVASGSIAHVTPSTPTLGELTHDSVASIPTDAGMAGRGAFSHTQSPDGRSVSVATHAASAGSMVARSITPPAR